MINSRIIFLRKQVKQLNVSDYLTDLQKYRELNNNRF